MATRKTAPAAAPAAEKPARKPAAKKAPGTALTLWEQEMAQFADKAKAAEKPVGLTQSIKFRAGLMTVEDQPVQGNELDVVVLCAIHENKWYVDEFDPQNPVPPNCYAFSAPDADDTEMVPHEESDDPQCESCAACEKNVMGSAEKGRGKACKNVRRLAVIPADALDSVEALESATIYTATVPVTSGKHYSKYVRSKVADEIRRPVWGVVTTMAVVPDPKNQFAVTFAFAELVDFAGSPELYEAMKKKVKEAEDNIGNPYPKIEEKPVQMPRNGRAAGRGRAAAPAPAAKPARGRAAPAAEPAAKPARARSAKF